MMVAALKSNVLIEALKPHKNWVVYKNEAAKNGKLTKVPYNARSGRKAASDKPDTWTDYQTAADALNRGDYAGLGWMFTKEAGIVGIDIDHCLDGNGRITDPAAAETVARLDSYTERSPSGDGLHIWTRGSLSRNFGSVDYSPFEAYESGRFFTITGDVFDGPYQVIEDRQPEIDWFCQAEKTRRRKAISPAPESTPTSQAETIQATLDRLHPLRANSYDEWVKVGMALQSEIGDSGLALWEKWSQQSSKFEPGECEKKWKSFDAGDGITWGTVVHWANEDSPLPARSAYTNGSVAPVADDTILALPVALKVLSTRDILTSDWPDPVWAVPGMLPAGLTFLAGKPKVGKSWLVLQLCLAIAAGGQFLGQKVEKGKVLYLALEDTPRRLKDRMDKQGWTSDLDCDFLTIGSFKDQIGDFRTGGAQVLAAAIQERGYKLVAIDTFSRTVFTNQLEQHEMSAILDPLQTMAHKVNSALLITDHMAKNAGVTKDPVIDIYGSVAKGATLDTAWGLYRERGKDEAELVIDGRDIDGQKASAVFFDGMLGCWQYQGDADSVKVTNHRKELMGVIYNEGPIGVKDLADLLGFPKGNVYRSLQSIVESLWATQDKDSKKYTLTEEGRRIIGVKDDNQENDDNQ